MEQRFDMEEHLRDHLEIMSPSPDFSKKMMGAIEGVPVARPSRKYINKKIIYGIGLFFLLPIAGMLVYGLASADWSAAGSGFELNLNFQTYFNSKFTHYLLLLNLVLGLVLLDKYLRRRRHAV
jgi:hypothetical protein